MSLLILGLIIWWATHTSPLVAPGARNAAIARLGETGWKIFFSLVTLLAIALMVMGYREAEIVQIYLPPAWGVHLNNLLMIVAVFLLGARHAKGRIKRVVRHPMLWALALWSAAHLLVRGDEASVMLFGSLGLWALAAMLATNIRDGAWIRPEGGTMAGDTRHGLITLAVFAVIVLLHWQVFGVRPFPG